MDPNPIKHEAVLLAHIRDEIEPLLFASGFRFGGRNNPPSKHGHSLWIDYVRGNDTLSIRFDRWIARMAAEILDGQGRVQIVAEVNFDSPVKSNAELMDRVVPFIVSINDFVRTLEVATPQ